MGRELAASTIRENYSFLKGMYIKDTVDAGFVFYSYSSVDYGDTDIFWNHVVMLQNIKSLETKITEAKKLYQEKGKSSGFHIPVVEPVKDVLTELKEKGFEEVFTDVWMFYTGEEISEGNESVGLEEVNSEGEMEKFVDLFYRSHAADLDDPYAGLSKEYGEQLKDKFSDDFNNFKVQHFIVKHGDESVGHITFIENGKMTVIYNLGTIPDYRGQGIATATLRKTMERLESKDLDQIFLQTEKASKNEDFFSDRGFETRLEAECLTD